MEKSHIKLFLNDKEKYLEVGFDKQFSLSEYK